MSSTVFFYFYIIALNITFIVFNLVVVKNLLNTLKIKRKFKQIRDTKQLSFSDLFSLGQIMFERGFDNESSTLFMLANQVSSNDDLLAKSNVLFYLAQTSYKSNNFDKAILFIRKALNLSSGLNGARYLLIQIFYKRKFFYNLTKESILKYCKYQNNTVDINSISKRLDRDDRI